jgi:hypothetical protein
MREATRKKITAILENLPEDTEKQLRLFQMFLKQSSPEEGYILATLGTAIRLNRVSDLWRVIEPLSEELAEELNHTPQWGVNK